MVRDRFPCKDKDMRKTPTKENGAFTLPELLIAVLFLTVLFTGVMLVMIKCQDLNEVAASSSTAVLTARNKLTEIENTAYAQINATYNNATFNVSGLNAKGVVYVDNATPNILSITVVVCWKQPNGRLFGEDANLNGQRDAGEDTNGNGRLDSIVQFTTLKYDV